MERGAAFAILLRLGFCAFGSRPLIGFPPTLGRRVIGSPVMPEKRS